MSEWHEQARAMKAADPGRSDASIGRELGVTTSVVWQALNPERNRESERRTNARRRAAKREWDRIWIRSEAGRARCERCGELAGIGTAQYGSVVCRSCRRAVRDERRERIAFLYHVGVSLREIATTVGYPAISVELSRMRADGWDLPYRYIRYGDEAAQR